jgi:hypothetical protein
MIFTCRKRLHDRIISLKGEVWTNGTSLISPQFIEVTVQSYVSERQRLTDRRKDAQLVNRKHNYYKKDRLKPPLRQSHNTPIFRYPSLERSTK